MPALSAYRHFFDDRIDVRPLAVCRIFIGTATFLRGLRTYREIDRLLRPEVIPAPMLDWIPELSRSWLSAYVGLWLVCAICFTVGFRTRLSGGILASLIAYQLTVDLNLWTHSVYLQSLFVFLLVLGNSGRDLSLDWIRRGRPHCTVPLWPVVLVKLQVAIVYFFAATAKVNPVFLSGEDLARALAYGAVAIEYFLAFGLWFRRTRWWAIASGLVLHLSLPVMVPGVGLFSLIILGAYPCFCDADEIRFAVRSLKRLPLGVGSRLARTERRQPELGAVEPATAGVCSMTRRSARFSLMAILLACLLAAAGIALPYPVLAPHFLYGESGSLFDFLRIHPNLLLGISFAVCPLGVLLGASIVGALSDGEWGVRSDAKGSEIRDEPAAGARWDLT